MCFLFIINSSYNIVKKKKLKQKSFYEVFIRFCCHFMKLFIQKDLKSKFYYKQILVANTKCT